MQNVIVHITLVDIELSFHSYYALSIKVFFRIYFILFYDGNHVIVIESEVNTEYLIWSWSFRLSTLYKWDEIEEKNHPDFDLKLKLFYFCFIKMQKQKELCNF